MSVYQEVTERFLKEMESGVLPWRRPWSVGRGKDWAYSHITGKPYSFINFLLCNAVGGEYLTYPCAKREGGYVNKGAKSCGILAPSVFVPKEFKDASEEEQKENEIFYFKRINVFPLRETTGIAANVERPAKLFDGIKPIEAAERVIADYAKRSGVNIICDKEANAARFNALSDTVVCPMKEQFEDVNEYYATMIHELAHSTGVSTRLNRVSKDWGKFGSSVYSLEEMVAEFATANVMRKLGLDTPAIWQNSAAYVKHWADHIKKNNRAIITAATRAEKAANMILGIENN